MSFDTVTKFEESIAEFYGAPYGVAVDCCTHGMELCLRRARLAGIQHIEIPCRTYLSVPMMTEKVGVSFDWIEDEWKNYYYLGNTNIIDAAVFWERDGYIPDTFMCLSFQFQKHLSLGRGGMILTDNKDAAFTLKKMSYDGRIPSVPWREQNVDTMGYHYYMTPETAQLGLNKLDEAINTTPREWTVYDWPNLRNMEIFNNE